MDYLPTYIAYQEAYHGAQDQSQIFFNDGKPVAVLPLAMKDGWVTSNGTDVVPPLFVDGLPEKVRKRIVGQALDEVQGRLKNDSWITHEIAFGHLSLWHTRVLEAGALACPHTVELFVDLGLDTGQLWSNIRKSYRSLIKQAERQYQVLVGVNIRPLQKLHLAPLQTAAGVHPPGPGRNQPRGLPAQEAGADIGKKAASVRRIPGVGGFSTESPEGGRFPIGR